MDERSFIERFRREGERRAHPGAMPAPGYECTWERFGRVLTAVGGTFQGPIPRSSIGGAVTSLVTRSGGRCVASTAAVPLCSG